MNDLETQLQNIQDKLQSLLKAYQLLQKENQQLKKEVEKQRLTITEQNTQLFFLQQEADVKKLGVKNWTKEEKKLLEQRIDTYLKEIDKCLLLLNA